MMLTIAGQQFAEHDRGPLARRTGSRRASPQRQGLRHVLVEQKRLRTLTEKAWVFGKILDSFARPVAREGQVLGLVQRDLSAQFPDPRFAGIFRRQLTQNFQSLVGLALRGVEAGQIKPQWA